MEHGSSQIELVLCQPYWNPQHGCCKRGTFWEAIEQELNLTADVFHKSADHVKQEDQTEEGGKWGLLYSTSTLTVYFRQPSPG